MESERASEQDGEYIAQWRDTEASTAKDRERERVRAKTVPRTVWERAWPDKTSFFTMRRDCGGCSMCVDVEYVLTRNWFHNSIRAIGASKA